MRYIWTIFFLVMLVSLAGCFSRVQVSEIKEPQMQYGSVMAFSTEEEYNDVVSESQQFIEEYPQSQDADNAQFVIGDSHYAQGKYEDAILAYQTVVAEYPTSDSADMAQLRIGDVYFASDDWKRSMEAYRQLTDKYPYLEVEAAQHAQNRIDAIESITADLELLESAPPNRKDNVQYHLAVTYLNVFSDYETAAKEFQKVVDNYPDSEMADNAAWMVGECYWMKASQQPLERRLEPEGEAFARIQHIIDRYPQLVELDSYEMDGYPHWPVGRRGDRYELYFAETRRFLNRYPYLKGKVFKDFLPEDYMRALEAWSILMLKYPDTDTVANAPQKIAQRLLELGKRYYNTTVGGSNADFSGVLFRVSLDTYTTPEAHIYMARYYSDVGTYTRWTRYRTRIFQHIAEAEKLVTSSSELASEIRELKTQMNYRLRIEVQEKRSRRK